MTETAPILSTVKELLRTAELHACLRIESGNLWNTVKEDLHYLPVDYCESMIDYQISYWTGNGFPVIDISLILFHDNRPCGLWPLSITKNEAGADNVGSNGSALVPPKFVARFAQKSIKSTTARCLVFIDKLSESINQRQINCVEAFSESAGFSDWHHLLMQGGRARVGLRHDLFLDLSLSIDEIKSQIRKSYKSLITSGGKLWSVELVTDANPAYWSEFKHLHREVSGRSTRSDESWKLQHDAISAKHAFFVCLRDVLGRMVGGGLFYVTQDEGIYAVGAYDRTLFDKPLGHVVQFCAIEEMKRRGIRWYKIGVRAYQSDIPPPTKKEIAISNFKHGFASHIFPRYEIFLSMRGCRSGRGLGLL